MLNVPTSKIITMSTVRLDLLKKTTAYYPIIDNHTHNLLKAEARNAFPFEALTSEASGEAVVDATESMALYRAVIQLAQLFGCEPSFDAVKKARDALNYDELCDKCLKPTGIVAFLLDDMIVDSSEGLCYDYKWHDRFATSPSKRIVRVESVAQDLIKRLNEEKRHGLETFKKDFESILVASCRDSEVVGFKSVVCYRSGLSISKPKDQEVEEALHASVATLKNTGKLRIRQKPLNDYIVRVMLKLAGQFKKPVQFHTGLGDNDMSLETANPVLMQPIFQEFPQTTIVLLHSSYPFSQEAGYLASVYRNVYLDFGEVFPIISKDGQLAIIRQILELTPTTKILWSTDGHWWPETYYLAVVQVREALYTVLADSITKGDLTESQAVIIVQRTLFHNSNQVYKLGLTPQSTDLSVARLSPSVASPPVLTLESLAASGAKYNGSRVWRLAPHVSVSRLA
ncbi:amidohydrolase 2 [Ramaria rubella]|nr:amidohydrolase 2 [Ramaria rubella]